MVVRFCPRCLVNAYVLSDVSTLRREHLFVRSMVLLRCQKRRKPFEYTSLGLNICKKVTVPTPTRVNRARLLWTLVLYFWSAWRPKLKEQRNLTASRVSEKNSRLEGLQILLMFATAATVWWKVTLTLRHLINGKGSPG